MGELKRTLGLAEVIFFATGVILGAGIYTVIGEAAGFSGNMLWLSFLIAASIALLTAFAYAELVAMYPSSSGEYEYVQKAFGPRLAVVIGILVAVCGIGGSATISIGFAGYFSQLLDFSETIIALCIIGFIMLVNISGIRQSSTFNIIFTIIEVGGLIFVVYTAWPMLGKANLTELSEHGINGLLIGAALSFFAFTGIEDTIKLAEETKKPEKNVPKALFIASAIVSTIYMAVVISAVSALPYEDLAASGKPLASIVETRFGHTGAIAIAVIALFSTSNSLLSNMLGASRVIYGMAKKNNIKLLSYVHSKRKTPVFALILAAGCAAALSLIGSIKTVALITNFFIFASFIFVNASVIRLRKKEKDRERPFRIPGSINNIPVLSIMAIMFTLMLMGYAVYGLMLK
jgi:basic amino acid/polyamine antiporter, APA family